ncbi:hypothetical protein Tco_1165156 [Tanacetum coccineum]
MESDEVIKSSVEDLVQTPSESEDLSNNESECDLPFCDYSPDFNNDSEIFSNPLFGSNDDYSSSDDESFSKEDVPVLEDLDSIPLGIENDHFNAEYDLIESLLNKDTVITSPKIDFLLEEFAGELALIKPIPPGIAKTNFDPNEDIRLIKKLLYDNSSPRPPEELNSEIFDAMIESFSLSPILVKDKGDILEELLTNDSLSLPENESFHFDRYYVPSFSRPPEKPPDDDGIYFDIKPDMGVLTAKAFNHGIFASKEEKSPHGGYL